MYVREWKTVASKWHRPLNARINADYAANGRPIIDFNKMEFKMLVTETRWFVDPAMA